MGKWVGVLFVLLWLVGCERPSPLATSVVGEATLATAVSVTAVTPATPTLAPTRLAETAVPLSSPTLTPTHPPTVTPTPFYVGELSPACGQLLPLVSPATGTQITTLTSNAESLAAVQGRLPAAALPALLRLLAAPDTVGLAAYRLGQEAEGVYLNADVPMPLASVVKVLTLVAYAETVAAGELSPLTTVPLADLEAFYQPGLDLGAHQNAVAALTENGRTFGDPPHILLEEVPGMMIRYSSNAAADYLHLLLGQTRLEQTAVSLGLTSQTAPCPFLGQFLAMANVTREEESDLAAIQSFLADPAAYGRYAMLLTDAYRQDADFRLAQQTWRSDTRRPNVETQRLFSATLNPQGSARDYAKLMAQLAGNGLSNGDSSYLARRYLEWPMQFDVNQTLFTNLGYKNGSLPGVLTTVYYAYPADGSSPIVVALFFRDLPQTSYRQWRRNLTYDEFARWLLMDPEAIPLLRAVVGEGG